MHTANVLGQQCCHLMVFKCSRVEDVDLFEEVRNVLFTNIIIRFYPGIYHPINGGWDKNSGGQKLLTALQLLRSQEGAT